MPEWLMERVTRPEKGVLAPFPKSSAQHPRPDGGPRGPAQHQPGPAGGPPLPPPRGPLRQPRTAQELERRQLPAASHGSRDDANHRFHRRSRTSAARPPMTARMGNLTALAASEAEVPATHEEALSLHEPAEGTTPVSEVRTALDHFREALEGMDEISRELAREGAVRRLRVLGFTSPGRIVDAAMPAARERRRTAHGPSRPGPLARGRGGRHSPRLAGADGGALSGPRLRTSWCPSSCGPSSRTPTTPSRSRPSWPSRAPTRGAARARPWPCSAPWSPGRSPPPTSRLRPSSV